MTLKEKKMVGKWVIDAALSGTGLKCGEECEDRLEDGVILYSIADCRRRSGFIEAYFYPKGNPRDIMRWGEGEGVVEFVIQDEDGPFFSTEDGHEAAHYWERFKRTGYVGCCNV